MAERRERFANEKHEYHDPRLLVGSWFDERARRETDYREFVDLYKMGELPMQQLDNYTKTLERDVKCTTSLDGRLINGSIVGLARRCGDTFLSSLPRSVTADGCYELPCLATGAAAPGHPVRSVPARSAIRVYREDQRIPDNVPLMHKECLVFCHAGSPRQLFLNKDIADPMPLRNVSWVQHSTGHSLWKTTGKDTYIAVNSPVVIHHTASGQKLTLDKTPIRSLLGVEHEAICTFGQQEPDTWCFVAPSQSPFSSPECRHLLHRNIWEILNCRY